MMDELELSRVLTTADVQAIVIFALGVGVLFGTLATCIVVVTLSG
jgi:hypothetical protein